MEGHNNPTKRPPGVGRIVTQHRYKGDEAEVVRAVTRGLTDWGATFAVFSVDGAYVKRERFRSARLAWEWALSQTYDGGIWPPSMRRALIPAHSLAQGV